MTLAPLDTTSTAVAHARTRLDQAMLTSAAAVGTRLHVVYDRFRSRDDEGMTTAEYAVGILAAVALAGVLLAVVKEDAVKTAMLKIVTDSLKARG